MFIKSYAKINLFLDVTGIDPDTGYHYIDSLFQEITLYDNIEIEKNETGFDKIIFENMETPGNSTVDKALNLFKNKFGINDNFKVHIKKDIPAGSGLGGGSSNAAYLLMTLAEKYGIGISQILDIGSMVGSDVPFFFYGGLCRVQGKGEIVTPLSQKLEGICFIIVYPGISVSTKWAYSLIDNYNKREYIEEFSKFSVINIDFFEKIVYNKFYYFVLKYNSDLSRFITVSGKES